MNKESKVPVFDREVKLVQLFGSQREVNPYGLLVQLSDISRRIGDRVYTITTDMDGTMVDTDLGTATLLRLMLDDRFYTRGNYDFESNFLSRDFLQGYQYAIENAQGMKLDLTKSKIPIEDVGALASWIVNTLCPNIIELYRQIQSEIRLYGSGNSEVEAMKRKLITIFDLLDLITIQLDSVFTEAKNGGIIPKTRMFAGLSDAEILDSVNGMFTDSQGSDNSQIHINESNLEVFNTAPGLDIPIELKSKPISLRVNKVTDVRRLLRMAVELNSRDADKSRFEPNTSGGSVHIVTTNWTAIARFVAEHRPYDKVFLTQLANFPETTLSQFIHGTRLRISNTGLVLPAMDGSAVLAERKREIAEINNSIMAIGDTPTDILMMATSLFNGGHAGVVGRNIEVTARTFHRLATIVGPERAKNIFFIQSNDGVRY